MLNVMQNLKEYYFMSLLTMYLFMCKHKKSYVNTLAIDRIKAVKLVEHYYTDSIYSMSPYLSFFHLNRLRAH